MSIKYKLFKIDWSTDFPTVATEYGQAGVGVGVLVHSEHNKGNYRIFGYTDEPEWIENTKRIQEGIGLYGWEKIMNLPCDIRGNRKFAIGRLEG